MGGAEGVSLAAVLGLALVSTALLALLRQAKPEFGVMLSVAACGLLLVLALGWVLPVVQEIGRLAGLVGLGEPEAQLLGKALGLCMITQLACDACRDAGESAIASRVELAGRAAVVALALPQFAQLLSIALGLIGW